MAENLMVYQKHFENIHRELAAIMDYMDVMNGMLDRIGNDIYPYLYHFEDREKMYEKASKLMANASELESYLRSAQSSQADQDVPF